MKKRYRAEVQLSDPHTFDIKEDFEQDFGSEMEAYAFHNERIDYCPDHLEVSWRRVMPIVTCDCGEEVWCEGFTNTCEGCGADYNQQGSRLAPREQWGEETGEQF